MTPHDRTVRRALAATALGCALALGAGEWPGTVEVKRVQVRRQTNLMNEAKHVELSYDVTVPDKLTPEIPTMETAISDVEVITDKGHRFTHTPEGTSAVWYCGARLPAPTWESALLVPTATAKLQRLTGTIRYLRYEDSHTFVYKLDDMPDDTPRRKGPLRVRLTNWRVDDQVARMRIAFDFAGDALPNADDWQQQPDTAMRVDLHCADGSVYTTHDAGGGLLRGDPRFRRYVVRNAQLDGKQPREIHVTLPLRLRVVAQTFTLTDIPLPGPPPTPQDEPTPTAAWSPPGGGGNGRPHLELESVAYVHQQQPALELGLHIRPPSVLDTTRTWTRRMLLPGVVTLTLADGKTHRGRRRRSAQRWYGITGGYRLRPPPTLPQDGARIELELSPDGRKTTALTLDRVKLPAWANTYDSRETKPLQRLQELRAAGDERAAWALAQELDADGPHHMWTWETLAQFYFDRDNPVLAADAMEQAAQADQLGIRRERHARRHMQLQAQAQNWAAAFRAAAEYAELTSAAGRRRWRRRRNRGNRALIEKRDDYLQRATADQRARPAWIRQLNAVPAPADVAVDGHTEDWKDCPLQFTCTDAALLRPLYSAHIAAMYDADAVYLLINWQDPTPMHNMIDPSRRRARGLGWRGDSVQIRFRMKDKLTSLDCWHFRPTKEQIIYRQHGGLDENPTARGPKKLYVARTPELGDGLAMAFKEKPNRRGYVQEIRVPWNVATDGDAPQAGDAVGLLLQLGWGRYSRTHTIDANVTPKTELPQGGLWERTEAYGDLRLLTPAKAQKLRAQADNQPEVPDAHAKADIRLGRRLAGDFGPVRALAIGSRGEVLAAADAQGGLHVIDAVTGRTLAMHKDAGAVNTAVHRPAARLAAATNDNAITVYALPGLDADPRRELHPRATCRGHTKSIMGLAYTRDAKRLASVSLDRSLRLWNPETGAETARFNAPRGLRAVALSPDGSRVAASVLDRTIRVWDIKSGQQIARLAGHRFNIRTLAFSPDGNALASGSDDLSIRIWDLNTGNTQTTLTAHTSMVSTVAWVDGRHLCSCGFDGRVILWDTVAGSVLAQRQVGSRMLRAAALAPGHKRVVVTDGTDVIRQLSLSLPNADE